MACGSCGGAGARAVEKWIYTSPKGVRTEVGSQAEANVLVTMNGGGSVAKKPN
jgi:hypothetical protein